jgi:hypothetical protein
MDAPIDPQTIKAGLLMEAAEAHQELATTALKQLDAVLRGVQPHLKDAVRNAVAQSVAHSVEQAVAHTLADSLTKSVADANRADFTQLRNDHRHISKVLHDVQRGANWKFWVAACAMSAVTGLAVAGGIYVLGASPGMGSADGVRVGAGVSAAAAPQGLRGDPAALAEFARRGIQVEVSLCGEQRRPCVKVDPKAGTYGPRKDFMVVPGALTASPAGSR